MESRPHYFTVALLAAVNVHLKNSQNRVMFGLGCRSTHAQTVRPAGSGHQWTKLAKEGASKCSESHVVKIFERAPGRVRHSLRNSKWLWRTLGFVVHIKKD